MFLFITKEKCKNMLKSLAFWVILGIILGIILGCVHKELALNVKAGVDYFIHALKILIGPIIL
ncbi:Putative C4-dicarboxylate transport protein [Campylobacter upsaliensis]|uniref:C4-dicarboxylate transport protein n=1 Tax=Campylobacter upsaliensis TaxID=28080 RepID=A0A381EGQ9_CAMUP|nr:Putative C4-dicarboxylate transport protein [Campylobacter upsaliensis]